MRLWVGWFSAGFDGMRGWGDGCRVFIRCIVLLFFSDLNKAVGRQMDRWMGGYKRRN